MVHHRHDSSNANTRAARAGRSFAGLATRLVCPLIAMLAISGELAHAQGVVRSRPGPECVVRIAPSIGERDPIALAIEGERTELDGRFRYRGRHEDAAGWVVEWDFFADPNPAAGASIEGAFDVRSSPRAPFRGTLELALPLDPLVMGPTRVGGWSLVRLMTGASGGTVAVGAGKHLWSLVADDERAIDLIPGPFVFARPDAGESETRPYLFGGGMPREKAPPVRDMLRLRHALSVDGDAHVTVSSRVMLAGDPAHFRARPEVEDARTADDSIIPRRVGDRLSVSVNGVKRSNRIGSGSRRATGDRVNKPRPVVRRTDDRPPDRSDDPDDGERDRERDAAEIDGD